MLDVLKCGHVDDEEVEISSDFELSQNKTVEGLELEVITGLVNATNPLGHRARVEGIEWS